jgi:hypothetical protein
MQKIKCQCGASFCSHLFIHHLLIIVILASSPFYMGRWMEEPSLGRAIAQVVNRWLPTAAARVWARIWSCEICGGQSGAGAGFLRVLRFPLPIFILLTAPQSPSSIIWGLYNRPEVAAVPSGLSSTPQKKVPSLIVLSRMFPFRFLASYFLASWYLPLPGWIILSSLIP